MDEELVLGQHFFGEDAVGVVALTGHSGDACFVLVDGEAVHLHQNGEQVEIQFVSLVKGKHEFLLSDVHRLPIALIVGIGQLDNPQSD